jgi:hypothetical protein
MSDGGTLPVPLHAFMAGTVTILPCFNFEKSHFPVTELKLDSPVIQAAFYAMY